MHQRFVTLALLLLTAALQAQSVKKLNADLAVIQQWFTGEFDNFQQVHREREDSVAQDIRHEHIHSVFAPVKLPYFSGPAFLVKQYSDGDEKKVYRQRVYHFTVNKAEKAIQLDIFSFTSKELEVKYANAHRDPALAGTIAQSELKPAPGCEVFWKRFDDHFIGYMKGRNCNFVSQRSGKRIYITDSLYLSASELWIRDEATDEQGNYVFGNKAKIAHKSKRCAGYKGWVAIAYPDPAKPSVAIRNLNLHDQGGKIALMLPDGTKTPYSVELSQVSYTKDLEVLKLALYKEGEPKSVAYTWAEVGSGRIGVNLRWFQAGFTKKPF